MPSYRNATPHKQRQVLTSAWLYARTGQPYSFRAAGFRETSAASGGPPPLAAGVLKGIVMTAESLAVFAGAFYLLVSRPPFGLDRGVAAAAGTVVGSPLSPHRHPPKP